MSLKQLALHNATRIDNNTHNFKESQTDFSFLLKVSITSVNAELHLPIPYIKRFTCWIVIITFPVTEAKSHDIYLQFKCSTTYP